MQSTGSTSVDPLGALYAGGLAVLFWPISLPLGSLTFTGYSLVELGNGRLLNEGWAVAEFGVGLLTGGVVGLAGYLTGRSKSIEEMHPAWLTVLGLIGTSAAWNLVHSIWSLVSYSDWNRSSDSLPATPPIALSASPDRVTISISGQF